MNAVKSSCVALVPGSIVLLGLVSLAGCGKWADDLVCEGPNCEFTKSEWARVQTLANLGDPAPDPSNAFSAPTHPAYLDAVALGWRLYHDRHFAGPATWLDQLGRGVPSARAKRCELGQTGCDRMLLACSDCHEPAHAGGDFTSRPGHVSEGSGWYDVNGQQVLNAGHYRLMYWNGRSDSLWSQAVAVIESEVSMNGNRLEIVRRVWEQYRTEYNAIFNNLVDPRFATLPKYPLPEFLERDALKALLNPLTGECTVTTPGECPAGCTAQADGKCWPRFPLRGKQGRMLGCNRGMGEPYDDAFDCMAATDIETVNRAFANFGKAIGAYEAVLASDNSSFDKYVNGAHDSLTPSAVRGLKLFVGRASCIDCHKTALFSDQEFHDIGVPQQGQLVPTVFDCVGDRCPCAPVPVDGSTPPATQPRWQSQQCLPWGYYNGLARLSTSIFRRDRSFSDTFGLPLGPFYTQLYDPTTGVDAMVPPDARTKGAWRTPSLRDVALTPPYMHDGVYRSLDDVIWHYDQGGTAGGGIHKAPELKPLLLSTQDRQDLVEFLKSLTGTFDPTRRRYHERPSNLPPADLP
jgi:cytochrome c peroxidase